jgi:hypothetical protein
MGWAVGWDSDHGRWRGYGVPAYCDAYAKGCREEIDRGLGYVCDAHNGGDEDDPDFEEFDDLTHTVFVCGQHTCADVDDANLPPEHPEWVEHVLTDDSWAKWREENPASVAALTPEARAETEGGGR